MRKKLLIIGTGHQSDLIKFDKFFTKQYQSANCIQLRNNSSILKQITENNIKNNDLIIAIGNNYLREKITKLLEKNLKKISWATYIAKSSNIKKNVLISPGSMIMENVFINCNTTIKEHVLINSGSIIEHDNFFDQFSSCGPGTITGGEVYIGKKTFLGLGSKIKNKLKIRDNSIIGMGSVVIKNCKSSSIYYGCPAKYIDKNKRENHF
jgi:sugar O-acyltransferase (sialic acid O-acetyltransferase NeuD family)